jgi:hypothetical protein
MSDGPHRSLNMNRSWKRLAECADNRAFSVEEVASALLPALDQSCREEVPKSVWNGLNKVFRDQQQTLFVEQQVEQISALRTQASGLPLACTLVDGAVRAISKGAHGEDALIEVTTRALEQRAARGNKQVEEHYYRRSNERRTEKVRVRLEGALKKAALDSIARRHLNIGEPVKVTRATKQSGLDDGVRF